MRVKGLSITLVIANQRFVKGPICLFVRVAGLLLSPFSTKALSSLSPYFLLTTWANLGQRKRPLLEVLSGLNLLESTGVDGFKLSYGPVLYTELTRHKPRTLARVAPLAACNRVTKRGQTLHPGASFVFGSDARVFESDARLSYAPTRSLSGHPKIYSMIELGHQLNDRTGASAQ